MRINLAAVIEIFLALAVWQGLYAVGLCPHDGPVSNLVIGATLLITDIIFITAGSGEEEDGGGGGIVGFVPVWVGGIILVCFSILEIVGAVACLGLVLIGVLILLILYVAGDSIQKDEAVKKALEKKEEEGDDLDAELWGSQDEDPWGEQDRKEENRNQQQELTVAPTQEQLWEAERQRQLQQVQQLEQQQPSYQQQPQQQQQVLKWIPCKRCAGHVPVYTTERPTVVSCENCGRRYKLNK